MGTHMRSLGLMIAVLCLGATASLSAAPATELAPPTVTVQNAAGELGAELISLVAETLRGRAEAIPQAHAPAAAPWTLEARITQAELVRDKARVAVVAELSPPAAGLHYVAEGYGEGPSHQEAASAAAGCAMEELGVCLNAKGTVYYCDDRGLEAWATLGSGQGLRPQARVAFLRNGEVVAEGTVVTARPSDAVVRPDKSVPAGTILLGDEVRVLRNGPRSAVLAQMTHERRERRAGTFLIYALLATCINLAK